MTNIAWNNLWYNKKRTILQLTLIIIALASLLLYKGYVEYSKEGMAIGFINKSGSIQIKNCDDKFLNKDEISQIKNYLKDFDEISNVECVLNFSGIIGNESESTIFWAEAYDNPELRYGVMEGLPIFENSDEIILGKTLSQKLNLNIENNQNNYVNILTNTNNSGMSLGSFEVCGITETGIIENDSGLVIASRKAIMEFLEEEEIASEIQIFLSNNKDLSKIQNNIKEKFADYNITNWIEKNPSYNQVNSINQMQYLVISVIMCILVFVALAQSLATSFNERMYEFAMLESIGLNKYKIFLMLFLECVFLVLIGIVGGLVFAKTIANVISSLNIEFIPPGYSNGFVLNFFMTAKSVISSIMFIVITCLCSVLIPIKTVLKNTVVNLMNRQE